MQTLYRYYPFIGLSCRSLLQVVAEELLYCFVIVDRAAGKSTLSLKQELTKTISNVDLGSVQV